MCYLGWYFSIKSGSIASRHSKCMTCMEPLLVLETWTRYNAWIVYSRKILSQLKISCKLEIDAFVAFTKVRWLILVIKSSEWQAGYLKWENLKVVWPEILTQAGHIASKHSKCTTCAWLLLELEVWKWYHSWGCSLFMKD